MITAADWARYAALPPVDLGGWRRRLGGDTNTVRQAVYDAVDRGELRPVGDGRYRLRRGVITTPGQRIDSGRSLTIRWPWIAALLWLGRPVEVRRTAPPASVVGRRVLLHCARTRTPLDRGDEALLAGAGYALPPADAYLGHHLGQAVIAGWVEMRKATPRWEGDRRAFAGVALDAGGDVDVEARELAQSHWLGGLLPARYRPERAFIWLMRDVRPHEPVAEARGQLGLWGSPAGALEASRAALVDQDNARLRAVLDKLAWDLGEPRREGVAYVLGDDRLRVKVSRARRLVEVVGGGERWRAQDLRGIDALLFELAVGLRKVGRGDLARVVVEASKASGLGALLAQKHQEKRRVDSGHMTGVRP